MKKVLKKYQKPILTQISLDQEISLIMMSWTNPDDPPPMDEPPISPSSSESTGTGSFEQNPFSKE